MTKGRAALPATVVAEQVPFFITSAETHFQERTADTADLSTTLRSGRDDKGEGGASGESGGRIGAVFHCPGCWFQMASGFVKFDKI